MSVDVTAFFKAVKDAYQTHLAPKKEDKEQKFASVTLQDGTMVMYEGDTPQMNMPIMIQPSDGSAPIPAPDGEINLPDGTIIEVTSGVITKITPAGGSQETEPPSKGAPSATSTQTQKSEDMTPAAVKSIVESITKETRFAMEKEFNEKLDMITKENAALKAEVDALKTSNESMSKFAKQLGETVDKFSDKPVNDSVKDKEKQVQADKKKPAESLEEFRKRTNQ